MRRQKKRTLHILDAWPPPKKKEEKKKSDSTIPRNVSYRDPWILEEPLEGPVYDSENPTERKSENPELEAEKDGEEQSHEK